MTNGERCLGWGFPFFPSQILKLCGQQLGWPPREAWEKGAL